MGDFSGPDRGSSLLLVSLEVTISPCGLARGFDFQIRGFKVQVLLLEPLAVM